MRINKRNGALILFSTSLLVLSACAGSSNGTGDASGSGGGDSPPNIMGCLDEAPAGGLSAGEAIRGSLEGVTLTYVGNGGASQEAQSAAYVQPFAECTGARVIEESGVDLAKLQVMVDSDSTQWDVAYAGSQLVPCELTEPLDHGLVDVSQNPYLEDVPSCLLPIELAANFFVYDTSIYTDEVPSTIQDFFDVEKFPGDRMLRGNPAAPSNGALGVIGTMLGYTEAEMEQGFPYDEVFDKIREIKDHLVWYESFAESQQMLESGGIAMADVGSGRAAGAVENGATVLPMRGEGTVHYGVMTSFVPKGTQNREAAFALLNYASGPQQQEVVTEAVSYSPVHPDASPQAEEPIATFVATPEDLENGINILTQYWFANREEGSERWLEFITNL